MQRENQRNLEKLSWVQAKILASTVLDEDAKVRISNKWFRSAGRHAQYLTRNFGFHDLKVLDIGSSYGQTLFFWGDESEAIEIQSLPAGFLRSCG